MGAPAQDFERLYQIVANNIKLINQNVNQIATMVKTMGNPSKDSHDLRIKLRDMIEDTRRSAADTNKSLKDLSHAQTTNPQEDKRRTSKLRNDFQSCLERFQDISKVAANKTNETFAPKPSKGGLLSNPAPFIDETEDEQHGLMQAQKRQQLMQLDADRDFQSALIEEREEGIKQIESTIQEVNDIFVDLATLVNEQAGMVDNIESHIDSTVSNTARGVVELRKAASYQEAARTKMCCLVVIILAVVAVVVVALVLGISLSLR
jgi:syntaxin 7